MDVMEHQVHKADQDQLELTEPMEEMELTEPQDLMDVMDLMV